MDVAVCEDGAGIGARILKGVAMLIGATAGKDGIVFRPVGTEVVRQLGLWLITKNKLMKMVGADWDGELASMEQQIRGWWGMTMDHEFLHCVTWQAWRGSGNQVGEWAKNLVIEGEREK